MFKFCLHDTNIVIDLPIQPKDHQVLFFSIYLVWFLVFTCFWFFSIWFLVFTCFAKLGKIEECFHCLCKIVLILIWLKICINYVFSGIEQSATNLKVHDHTEMLETTIPYCRELVVIVQYTKCTFECIELLDSPIITVRQYSKNYLHYRKLRLRLVVTWLYSASE